MNINEKLQDFFDKFKTFETKDGQNNFDPKNTTFDITKWIDQLRNDLFANNYELATEVVKLADKTPFAEFQYSWKYIQQVIKEKRSHFTWTDVVYPNEADYYALQNLSTFIFSLLNRLTMDRHVIENEDYLAGLTQELQDKGYSGEELGNQIRDKLKRVTFTNWRYNPLLKQFDKSYLWDKYLKESRNVNEHYGVLFKTGDPSKFDKVPATFYAEIIIELYLFLYFLKYYILELKTNQLKEKKD